MGTNNLKICLASRFFDIEKSRGTGRIARELLEGLKGKEAEIEEVKTFEEGGSSLSSYFIYSSTFLPLFVPRGAWVYHALSPIEAFGLPKEKTVVTFNDMMTSRATVYMGTGFEGSKLKKTIGRTWYGICSKEAAKCIRITSISEETKKDVSWILGLPEEKVEVVKPGIKTSKVPTSLSTRDYTVYGYLGQLNKRKRVEEVIKAFDKTGAYGSGVLLIAGEGNEYPTLKKLSNSLRCKDSVFFIGQVPEGKMSEFYSSIHFLVFPSLYEGLGLPIAEAMACETPIVTLEDSYIPWDIKSRCSVVKDLDTFFDNPNSIIQGPQKRKEIAEYIKAEYNWGKYTNRFIEIYKEIANS